MNKQAREIDKGINEILGTFTDPIIVMPGGWGETLPSWLKDAITLERLLENMRGFRTGTMTATDAEACAYLYTALLDAPPSHDWAQIYLYVAGNVIGSHRPGTTMPDDIKVAELTRNQQDDLAHLKAWIYERRVKHRKGQEHDQRKEEVSREKAADPQLVFNLWGGD